MLCNLMSAIALGLLLAGDLFAMIDFYKTVFPLETK